jgi:hypothetical protein
MFAMGWNFRKVIGLGPLRINLSKRGVGFSIGGRGFRLGRDGSGRSYTHTSLPGTGIYRRDYIANGQPLRWTTILRWAWPVLLAVLVIAAVYAALKS